MTPLDGYTVPTSGPIPFVVCDSNGLILRTGLVPDDATGDAQAQTGEYVFAGVADEATQYVDDPTGTPTATSRSALGITYDYLAVFGPFVGSGYSVFLHDVPIGATVTVDKPNGSSLSTTATDTEQQFRFGRAGQHTITVTDGASIPFVLTFPVGI